MPTLFAHNPVIHDISPEDSVCGVGSSQVSGSSTRLAEPAACKKRATIKQQLYKAERERCEAERELHVRDVEGGIRRT